MNRFTIRSVCLLAVCALAAFALAACGADEADDRPAAATTTGAAAEEAALPATIAHKFGETTVTKAPKRVVVVGLREQDALLALGVVPVGTTEWFGKHPGAIFPWAEEALGDAPKPTVLTFTDGLQIERVAALRPDLILGVYSGMSSKDYATLSKIAPTVAQPPGQVDWGSSWQDELLTTGKAIGRPKEAQRLLEETEKRIAGAAEANPGFKGQKAVVASTFQGVYVYGPQDARSRFLVDLGFAFPDELRDIGGGKEFGGQLSGERMDLLDVGAAVWFADPPAAAKVRRNPVYRKLKVREEGRDVFLAEQGTLYEATSFISVLSIPTLLDGLVPRLAAAADGDPSTKPQA
ncbi:MAG: iron-siderophore transport system substrate-binding protein [Solirubrobacteraceae bacterium]|nr:iron-siderophore transport system substrate-binding protein [Solirubrobacteraceae bacterium]